MKKLLTLTCLGMGWLMLTAASCIPATLMTAKEVISVVCPDLLGSFQLRQQLQVRSLTAESVEDGLFLDALERKIEKMETPCAVVDFEPGMRGTPWQENLCRGDDGRWVSQTRRADNGLADRLRIAFNRQCQGGGE